MSLTEAALGLSWVTASAGRPVLGLLEEHGVQAVWRASASELRRWSDSGSWIPAFLERRSQFMLGEAQGALRASGLRFMPYGEGEYPTALKQLPWPPAGLYVRAETAAYEAFLHAPRVTIVGTRVPTAYGRALALSFGEAFAQAGVVVVSGMALGIDSEAHRGSLSQGGLTVAVLGCGADRPYPRRHRDLYQRIAGNGALISELPPGWPPAPWTFPLRNRLLAALGDAVVVVEAGARSGALSTADWALELGKQVFVVPGPINSPTFMGSTKLLHQGAACCLGPAETVEDFFAMTRTERYGRGGDRPPECVAGKSRKSGPARSAGDLGPAARLSLLALARGAQTVDEVAAATGLAVGDAAAALALLELRGVAARAGLGRYMLVS
ncbi:MAG: DNA-processing protein DprA [Thermoleophilia bacterium]|nr:DNA-processing protein DprA [Thermoleophilia bacterium]